MGCLTGSLERVEYLMDASGDDAGERIRVPSVSLLRSLALHRIRFPGSRLAIGKNGAIVT